MTEIMRVASPELGPDGFSEEEDLLRGGFALRHVE